MLSLSSLTGKTGTREDQPRWRRTLPEYMPRGPASTADEAVAAVPEPSSGLARLLASGGLGGAALGGLIR